MVVDPNDEVLVGVHHVSGDLPIEMGHVEEVHHVVHLSCDEVVEQKFLLQHLSIRECDELQRLLPMLQEQ